LVLLSRMCESVASMASRVIICKLGRMGELRKILDRSTVNNLLQTSNDDEQERHPSPMLSAQPARHSVASPSLALRPFEPGGSSILRRMLSTEDMDHNESEEREVQVLNAEGGLYLDDDLKRIVYELGVGDAVSTSLCQCRISCEQKRQSNRSRSDAVILFDTMRSKQVG